jgi:hypothetical protein
MARQPARSPSFYTYDEAGHLLGEYDGTGTPIEETVWAWAIPPWRPCDRMDPLSRSTTSTQIS